MKTKDFDYDLPKKFIAMSPAAPRDSSRLMVLGRKTRRILHKRFFELPEILEKRFGSNVVLVFNDSKVIPARINFRTGGKNNVKCEILLLKKIGRNIFECLVRPGRKFRTGTEFAIAKNVKARVLNVREDGVREISFILSAGKKWKRVLTRLGTVPFPPYLKGTSASASDYQTIYARCAGSAAAPTAGLHFTKRVLKKLREAGLETVFLTLHVGLGTFQPVNTARAQEHKMHSEYFSLSRNAVDFLNKAKRENKKIIAVGTTSVRVLESCVDAAGKLRPCAGETDIFIYPGYKWKFIDGMITNFHFPKSTLIMLVSAFAGREFVMKAYKEAKQKNYRFYSFGDAMLII